MPVLQELNRLTEERFLALYEALSEKGFGPLDAEVAKALKFRPTAIRKLPMEKRAKKARSLLSSQSNAELCYELFGSYLVRTKKELVVGFLDATCVAHEDGMISDVDANVPDDDKIAEAVTKLDQEFDAEDVTLYLALSMEHWPESEVLAQLWRERSGATS